MQKIMFFQGRNYRNCVNFVSFLKNQIRTCTFEMESDRAWKSAKENILMMPLINKRQLYRSQMFVDLDNVLTWPDYVATNQSVLEKKPTQHDHDQFKKAFLGPLMNTAAPGKVSIYRGDITLLEVDAIVNAANERLIAGGGVDGAIHRAAGPWLQAECNSLKGCPTGSAKVTGGYHLPAKYVIHTVGPQDGSEKTLQSCYEKCLSYQQQYELKSIAFPCISTGIYGFPNRLAAHIALRSVRKFLESNTEIDRVIFCTFLSVDIDIYETLMQMYFPLLTETPETTEE